jgi:hypothetical protein
MVLGEVRSGVIVLSVWIESTDPNDLRVRFAAAASEGGSEDPQSFAACGIDNVCVRLRTWLECFARGDSDPALPRSGEPATP